MFVHVVCDYSTQNIQITFYYTIQVINVCSNIVKVVSFKSMQKTESVLSHVPCTMFKKLHKCIVKHHETLIAVRNTPPQRRPSHLRTPHFTHGKDDINYVHFVLPLSICYFRLWHTFVPKYIQHMFCHSVTRRENRKGQNERNVMLQGHYETLK